ncbi:MAG: tyrosine-type recombinase/integrase [Planctomycetota bacterium]|jgi:integrase
MTDIVYSGPFKDRIKRFVDLKQAVGYKYLSEAAQLKRFDTFTIERGYTAETLTKQIAQAWCSKLSYESQANQNARASVLRQFCTYLVSVGVTAYIIPKGYYPCSPRYIPHIYTHDELQRFFAQTDTCHSCYDRPFRHLVMPVFFRMIYLCGLRVSEARLLTVGDVDLTDGILQIHHSKKDNSRLIPMADTLTRICRRYSETVHVLSHQSYYYFPGAVGKPMTNTNVYHNFRRFLWQAGISHGGRGSGPRVHDFRHTFAVHCLKRWSEKGHDLLVYLPILKTYMGHESFRDTAYYLRMTAEVFPEITLQLEQRFPDLIPEVGGFVNETD